MLCTQSKKHITGRIPNDSTNASTTRTMVKSQVKHPLSHPFSGISVSVGRPQRGFFLEGTGYSNGSGFEHLGEQALIQDGESENPETVTIPSPSKIGDPRSHLISSYTLGSTSKTQHLYLFQPPCLKWVHDEIMTKLYQINPRLIPTLIYI